MVQNEQMDIEWIENEVSFRTRISIPLFPQKSLLEETETLKYLGITLDKNLNLDEHIKDLSGSWGSILQQFRYCGILLPKKFRLATTCFMLNP